MFSQNLKALFMLMITVSFLLTACTKEDVTPTSFGIFTVLDDSTTIEMDGVIKTRSLEDFNELIALYPNTNQINIKNCDGSSNDDINLQLSKKVHERNMDLHIMDDGSIASGGTDFFLAGKARTKGDNTMIGVHSWSGLFMTATDFPEGHENHLPYIDYYVSVGFSQQQAEDFYYFTINAAPADSIHWMTDQELEQYNILTE